jgi:DNA invertase Pin-like site-specific DNA recombinase
MLVGYMFATEAEGEAMLERQLAALDASRVPILRKYQDYTARRSDARPGLEACLKSLSYGEILVVWKLARLGRDVRHLVMLLDSLTRRGVELRVLADPPLDTTDPRQRPFVLATFGAIAELEHELRAERAHASLASARARGRNGGRPPRMTAEQIRRAQAAMAEGRTKVSALCAEFGISRQAFYEYLGPDGQLRPRAERLLSRTGAKG